MSKKTNILLTGTGSLIGQAIIKSIHRSDLKEKIGIIGMDYFKDTVGAFWADKNYLLPDILKPSVSDEEWLEKIILTANENEVKLIFVGVDFELPLFAKYKEDIEAKTKAVVLVSSSEVIAIGDDKFLTVEFLKKNGLPYPESYISENVDYDKLDYPIIIKPRQGARSIGVYKVDNKEELESVVNNVDAPIFQEHVGNAAEEYTCGTLFLNGELKRLIILKRSLKEGNTFISQYHSDFPEVITEYLEDVCKILKPFGACNFQLRVDESGKPKIFEINSRHSGTTYIRSLFGYKEIEYMINLLLFNKEIDFDLREGTVVRYYDEFFVPSK